VEAIDGGITSWKDYELDEAYRNYVKDTVGGFAAINDDWALMCATQMRGYLIRLQDDAKKTTAQSMAISRSELDKERKTPECTHRGAGGSESAKNVWKNALRMRRPSGKRSRVR